MTKRSTFFRLRLKNVATRDEDAVTALCFDYGAQGVAEDLNFIQTSRIYEPELVGTETHCLDVFFQDVPSEGFFSQLAIGYPELQIEKNEEENRDWLEEWKKGYHPFPLVSSYWVVPTWREAPEAAERAIYIDPGMAFGTGTHETTQLAAQMIVDVIRTQSIRSVLDVGTGTGILAFLAECEGVDVIDAIEIDDEARRVARENVQLNNLTRTRVLDASLEQISEVYDLVIANIIDGILLRLKADLLARSRTWLVLTGLLGEREKEFFREFTAGTDLSCERRLEHNEWVGLLLNKNSH